MSETMIIQIVIGAVLAIGGFVGTVFVGALSYFIKKLIGAVDKLTEKITAIELDMKDRPHHTWVKEEAGEIVEARVVRHESEKHNG